MKKLTTQQFIEKARVIHGDKYDYPFNYKNNRTKIKIKCNIHGIFEQLPNSHLLGSGCTDCGVIKRTNSIKFTQEEFIIKANLIHNNKYDYSKILYLDIFSKICIICPKHGVFWQTPNSHLNGTGCPVCKASKGERLITYILDKHNIEFIPQFKIPGNSYRFRYDFYLPEYNTLIEFHGIQHYEPRECFGGLETFKDNQRRDMFKKELAKLANIPLLEFNYKHLKIVKNNFEKIFLLSLSEIVNRTKLKGELRGRENFS